MEHDEALWTAWRRLREGLEVDWDLHAFCTVPVPLGDGDRFGTLCVHHREPRAWSEEERSLLSVLARLLGGEIARERARRQLAD